MTKVLLAIDQGTTSSRAIIFSDKGELLSSAQHEFKQYFPQDGWVEHDPQELWNTSLQACKEAISMSGAAISDIAGIGISNQRETTIVWDRLTGEAIYPAIVWQDRRTAKFCEQLKNAGHETSITDKTGLLLDPYFSASKLAWILDEVAGARQRASQGQLLFGTVDSYLLWQLTGGRSHYTDATNASRTMLFNIHQQQWDDELLALFNIPKTMLPEVRDCSADFGSTTPSLFGKAIPIGGMAGDQQAALIGQACFQSGMAKSTYGTGCFVILNTGEQALQSNHRLLTTVAYRLNGKVSYAIEGSIFNAGTTVQWLRDSMKVIDDASETEAIATRTPDTGGVYLVPAFTGMGAPYWQPDARGALLGLTRDSNRDQLVTAALQSVAFQSRDLLQAMAEDGLKPITLRVDGGMAVNNWLMQFIADILGIAITRPIETETTALGVAYLAGLQQGIFGSLDEINQLWQERQQFTPTMKAEQANTLYNGWLEAIAKITE